MLWLYSPQRFVGRAPATSGTQIATVRYRVWHLTWCSTTAVALQNCRPNQWQYDAAVYERLAADPASRPATAARAELGRGDVLCELGCREEALVAYERVVAVHARAAEQDTGHWNAAFGLQAPAAQALAARRRASECLREVLARASGGPAAIGLAAEAESARRRPERLDDAG
jgi:hypothetical protein